MGVEVDIDMDIKVEEVRREAQERDSEVAIGEGLQDVLILEAMEEDVEERHQDPQFFTLHAQLQSSLAQIQGLQGQVSQLIVEWDMVVIRAQRAEQ